MPVAAACRRAGTAELHAPRRRALDGTTLRTLRQGVSPNSFGRPPSHALSMCISVAGAAGQTYSRSPPSISSSVSAVCWALLCQSCRFSECAKAWRCRLARAPDPTGSSQSRLGRAECNVEWRGRQSPLTGSFTPAAGQRDHTAVLHYLMELPTTNRIRGLHAVVHHLKVQVLLRETRSSS